MIGCEWDGWVPTRDYEEAMARNKQVKEGALAHCTSDKERAEITTQWPWDDMDEEKYM